MKHRVPWATLWVVIMAVTTLAFQVYGAIGQKWHELGAEKGPLGAPVTDELDAARGGRHNDFQYGFIYWHPNLGAHAVYGLIGEKWNSLGREKGFGYPITDEMPAHAGGRYNDFEGEKSIYWNRRNGAHAIYGAIRAKWVSKKRELSAWGYPKTDEYQDGAFRRVDFDCGYIRWSPQSGVRPEGACQRFDDGSALNPVPE
jgi:uncharacterized protein with LGFP repeats